MFQSVIKTFSVVSKRFAGHSKWANIRHMKGIKDAEKSTLFTKLSRQMKVAVNDGGSNDPNKNLKLSQVITQCKRFNMPVASIQSVLKSCSSDKSNLKTFLVDIKGPGHSILVCEFHTNNIHQIRTLLGPHLKKTNSKWADGVGKHNFEEKGVIIAENPNLLNDKARAEIDELITEHAIECNAEEVQILDENYCEFLVGKEKFFEAQNLIEKLGYKIISASIDYLPLQWHELNDNDLTNYENLMKRLNNLPEVNRIFDNVINNNNT